MKAIFIHRVVERETALDLSKISERGEVVLGRASTSDQVKLTWNQKMTAWSEKVREATISCQRTREAKTGKATNRGAGVFSALPSLF